MKLLLVCLIAGVAARPSDVQQHPGMPPMGMGMHPPFGMPPMGMGMMPFGPRGPPPPPPFLKDVDEDARDEFMKLFENENLSRGDFKAQVYAWAQKQSASVQKQVADFEKKKEEHKQESKEKLDKVLKELGPAMEQVRALYENDQLTRKERRKQKHAILDDLTRETSSTVYFLLGMFRPRFAPPPPPPHGGPEAGPESLPEGPMPGMPGPMGFPFPPPPPFGGPFAGLIGGPRPHFPPPPPPFLKNVTEEAREEFMKLLENENLPKSDFKKEVELWAQKQSEDVQKAVARFERKMEQSAGETKQKIQKVLSLLPNTFDQVDSVLRDETLTRKQEFKKLRQIFDDLDRKEAVVAHMIMAVMGPRPPFPHKPHHPFGMIRGPFGMKRGIFKGKFGPYRDEPVLETGVLHG